MECPHCHKETTPKSKTCRFCGRSIPPAQYLLEQSGILEDSDIVEGAAHSRSEKPQPRQPEDDLDESPYQVATLGDRFLAFILDSAFLFGAFAIVDSWVFMRWGVADGAELKLSLAALLIAESLNVVILFVYFWLLEASFGATPGKAIVGIRVVRTADTPALKAFAIRNALRLVDGLGFYLVGAAVAGCSAIHRRVGDMCAGTAVIEEEFGYPVKIGSVLLWLALVAGAIWSVPRICTTNLAIHPRYLDNVVVRVGVSEHSVYFTIASLRLDARLGPTPAR
jgi:uncharacterized RDD family membrane protein YckC